MHKTAECQFLIKPVPKRQLLASVQLAVERAAGVCPECRHEIAKPIHVGIITIKEEEFQAVERRFAPIMLVHGKKRSYLQSQITTPGGTVRHVLIARCLEQGQSDAQQCTNDLLHDANPDWILLVGIAGAFPVEEYTLGDVLLASRVYDFAVTAAIEGGAKQHSPKGGGVHPEVSQLLQMIPSKACEDKLGGWNGAEAISMPKPCSRFQTSSTIRLSTATMRGGRKFEKR